MRYFVVDAFTDTLFSGNPAGVCLPETPLDEALMQRIAAENNLSETAFVVPQEEAYSLRWFTPKSEINLCGHGTLASAFVLHAVTHVTAEAYRFQTKSGLLTVTPVADGLYEMDFPAWPVRSVDVTPEMEAAFGCHILEAHAARDLLLLLENEAAVHDLRPDFAAIVCLPGGQDVVVTAKGDSYDFVSRFFAPAIGIPEDPVTGSSHSQLIPFWTQRLGKNRFTARQLSARGGTLYCEDCGERVKIAGRVVLYLAGEIHI